MHPISVPGMTLHGTGVARRMTKNFKENVGFTNHQSVEVLPFRTLTWEIEEATAMREKNYPRLWRNLSNRHMTVTVMEIMADLRSIEQEEGTSNDKVQIRNIGGYLKESYSG